MSGGLGVSDTIEQFFSNQLVSFPEVADEFSSLASDYNKKLYHQLTQRLLALIVHPFFSSGDHLLRMYDNFVRFIETDVNQLDLVVFGVAASQQQPNALEAIAFLETLLGKVVAAKDSEAALLCRIEIAPLRLRAGDAKACQVALDAARTEVDAALGLDARVHSALYRAAMELHKAQGGGAHMSQFYRNALLFLGYTPAASVSPAQRVALASEIALSALLGEEIFNFGELLQHDILASLAGTPHAWVHPLLTAFSTGDIAAFDACMRANSGSQAALAANAAFLQQKIRLMALVELAFGLAADARTIAFARVAAHCQLAGAQVELLLMKAMSLGLVRGVIDQVDETVRVTWAQPRVLDKAQIMALRDQMGAWAAHVDRTSAKLEANAPELFL